MTAPLPARIVRCLAAVGLVLAAGCASTEPGTSGPGVCGFFSTASVQDNLDADSPQDFEAGGSGMLPAAQRASDTANCVVTDSNTGTARISAVIADYDERRTLASVERQLAAEVAKDARCTERAWDGLGQGSVCALSVSTQLAVATPERLIRIDLVAEGGEPPASVATALDFAEQANRAAQTYDERNRSS